MRFQDPIVGGTTLIRPAIKSPNYVAGVSGWSINRDGSAEFNNVTVRGDLFIQGSGSAYIHAYSDAGNPIIEMNDDPATYPEPAVIDVLSSDLELVSPGASVSTQAAIFLRGIAVPRIELAAPDVVADAYAYQASAAVASTSSNSSTVTPGNQVTVVSLAKTDLIIGRDYKIVGGWQGIFFGTPVAVPGNRATMRLAVDGTFRHSAMRLIGHNTGIGQLGGTLEGYFTATATSHTFQLILVHDAASTAGNVGTSAASDGLSYISVDGWSF